MTTVIEGTAALSASAGQQRREPVAVPRGRGEGEGGGTGTGSGATRWRIVPVGPGDGPALDALFAACSPQTVRLRFFGAPRSLPPEYAAALLAGRPDVHDAVIAYEGVPAAAYRPADPYGPEAPYGRGGRGGPGGPVGCGAGPYPRPVGLASLAAAAGAEPLTAEIGVLVADVWQRQGAGTAMTAALLERARSRGVERVAACVLPTRGAMLRAVAGRLGLLPTAVPGPGEPPAVTYDRAGDSLTAVYRLRPTAHTHGTGGEVHHDDT